MPAPHLAPQPPQLFGSLLGFTHLPSQQSRAGPHAASHPPLPASRWPELLPPASTEPLLPFELPPLEPAPLEPPWPELLPPLLVDPTPELEAPLPELLDVPLPEPLEELTPELDEPSSVPPSPTRTKVPLQPVVVERTTLAPRTADAKTEEIVRVMAMSVEQTRRPSQIHACSCVQKNGKRAMLGPGVKEACARKNRPSACCTPAERSGRSARERPRG